MHYFSDLFDKVFYMFRILTTLADSRRQQN
jgi:hypothetical protein